MKPGRHQGMPGTSVLHRLVIRGGWLGLVLGIAFGIAQGQRVESILENEVDHNNTLSHHLTVERSQVLMVSVDSERVDTQAEESWGDEVWVEQALLLAAMIPPLDGVIDGASMSIDLGLYDEIDSPVKTEYRVLDGDEAVVVAAQLVTAVDVQQDFSETSTTNTEGLDEWGMLLLPLVVGGAIFAGNHSGSVTSVSTSSPLPPVPPTPTVNQAPIFSAVDDQSIDEDHTLAMTLAASDIEGDALTFSAMSSHLQVLVVLDGNQLVVTPNENFNGEVLIELSVSDGINNLITQNFLLTIHPVNDAPELAPINNHTMTWGTVLLVPLIAKDVDGDTLMFKARSDQDWVSLAVHDDQLGIKVAEGMFPPSKATIVVQVSDGALTDVETFMIKVSPFLIEDMDPVDII